MRGLDVSATLLATLGVTLGLEAWFAGSLFRYQLAGLVAGGALCVPGLSIVILRERARRGWRKIMFALVPLVAVLLLVELGMQLFGGAAQARGVLIEDDRLGHVMTPGSGGTDEQGFRNARIPDRVDTLFIGDSQTWGFFIEREQSFPAVFAAQTNKTSYQMANGAYGPVHYRELLRRGVALKPQLVVVGFYFGNDLLDAVLGAGLEGAEDLRTPGQRYNKPRNPELDGDTAPNWTLAFVDMMQEHSRLCGWVGRAIKSGLRGTTSFLDDQPGAVHFHHDDVGTILLPRFRQPLLDLAKPRIADGLAITARCLTDIAARCKAGNTRCVLLLIPTKEYCYAEWQSRSGKPISELAALHAAESTMRERIFAAARNANLEFVDLTAHCIDALTTGTPIWAGNGDGHLMVNGHLAAARAIQEISAGK